MSDIFDFFSNENDRYTDQIPAGNQRDLFERSIEASIHWEGEAPQDKQDIVDGWLEAMEMMGSHANRAFDQLDAILDYLGVEFDADDWEVFRENYHP